MTRTNDMCLEKLILFLAASATVLTYTQGTDSSYTGHVLEFIVEPTDTVVEAGQSAVLDCVVKASQHQSSVLIQWMDKDAAKLTFMGDMYRNQLTNGSLYISNITEEQRLTGTYQCMATLPNVGSIISRTATLSIAKLHGFVEEPQNQSVYLGQKAHFACLVESSPPSKIRWLKDDRPLQIDELRMTVLPSGALEIDEVQESDQGWYRCNATGYNTYKLSNRANLVVNGDQAAYDAPPSFIYEPKNAIVVEGQNVSLDCAANGNPIPSITWLKDGYNIDMNDLDSRFSLVGSTNSLRITRIKEEDAGTYQCRAENKEESFDKSAIVQVQVPPRFLTKPQDKIEHVSNNVELECEVYGIPKPKIQWFKNGEPIVFNEYYKIVDGHNLKITGLLNTDSGLFQCFASNPAGNIQAAASLRVQTPQDKRKAQKTKPKKVRIQNDEQLLKKQSKLAFNTLKDDDDSFGLGETNFAHTAGASTNIDDARRAFSSLKSSESNDNINLGDVQSAFHPPPNPIWIGNAEKKISDGLPGPPQDLKALMVKAKFIILSWSPPMENIENIQMYSVYYRQEGSNREIFQNTTRSRLEEMSIQNLTPGKVYHFRVVAYNHLGAGLTSRTLTVTTQSEEHVASAPQQFEVYATSARSVHLSWEPPENPNGDIRMYNAYYMETSASLEHKVDTSELSYEVTGLSPYTEYLIWVVAVNVNGPGAATEEKLVRTFGDVPSEPPNNITVEPKSTSAVVRWEPPPLESQNGVILSYKIKYRKQGKGKPVTLQTTNVHQYVIKDLERGTNYQIRLWAMNLNGTSPPTDWTNMSTFENDVDESRVPDKPAALNARSNSDVLYVMWAPPNNQNTRVRNYILSWGKGVPDIHSHTLDESNRTYVIKNLEPNSEYVLSIRASNQMGTGPPKYMTIRTQDEPPPEPAQALMPPIGLKAHVITPTSVVLYWTDPTLTKSQIVRDNRVYIIQYTIEKSLKLRHQNTSNLNIMIDDLKPNTNYEFAVKLVKGAKESPWSMVVTNKTFELAPVAPRDLDIHFKDEESQLVELTWQPPRLNTGRITGYVILYTDNKTKNDREWQARAVKGENHSNIIYDLKPLTLYFFKVQARNSRGYGPFSNIVSFRTGQNVASSSMNHQNNDSQGVFSKTFLLYLTGVGCLVAVATVAGVVIFFCCRKKEIATTSPDRSKKGYQKGSQSIKPPDLWIHHDQMELKAMEKRHSNNDGASSSGAMTLPRSVGGNDYDNHESIHTNSLDKRNYVPNNYGGNTTDDKTKRPLKSKPIISLPVDSKPPREPIATPINTATLSQSSSDSTPSSRPSYQRPTQYSMPRGHIPNEQHLPNTTPTDGLYAPQHPHGTYDGNIPNPGYISQPPVAHVPPGSTYAPGMNILADQAAKRAQGQGHPLKSFTVPAPPPISAPGTPQAKHIVTVRPNSSPFKKPPTSGSTSTLTSTPPSRISASNPPPHTPEEVQRLHSSHSTEELNQEMANLEGLMLTLNAITANEFEC